MKKSLIALAVLGASGFAMAQSSVTLYGVADAGISRTQAVDPVTGVKTSKTNMAASGTMNNGTSRLGVKGVEDLGGGLKAGFNFEHGLTLANGKGNLSGGEMWSRAANMWIGGNWGTFQMGRALNPTFFAVAAWELTGTANYSVVGNTYGFTNSNGPRTSNLFVYKTPNFSGLNAQLGYVLKDDNGGNSQWDLNAVYSNGPIAASLGVNKTQTQDTSYVLGGKYNFGQFAVAASYNQLQNKRRGFSIGGTANFGAASVTLDLTRDTKYVPKKYTNALLEGKYSLSKRTFVYAAYLRLDSTNNFGVGLRHNF